MKKYFILVLSLFLGSFCCSSVFANENSVQFEKSSINLANVKSQADSISSKYKSLERFYKSTVDNLSINLLSNEEITKLKEENSKIRNSSKNSDYVNTEVIKNEISFLNKFFKSSKSTKKLASLTVAQKVSIKKDLDNLEDLKASFVQLATQSERLSLLIKAQSFLSVSLKEDLQKIQQINTLSIKQVKNIAVLSENLDFALMNAGLQLK